MTRMLTSIHSKNVLQDIETVPWIIMMVQYIHAKNYSHSFALCSVREMCLTFGGNQVSDRNVQILYENIKGVWHVSRTLTSSHFVEIRYYWIWSTYFWYTVLMMTSLNGNLFRVTGHLCGEFNGPWWIPRTKASDMELWYFLWSKSE